MSQLSQLICDLKDGYNTYLGERGLRLSGSKTKNRHSKGYTMNLKY